MNLTLSYEKVIVPFIGYNSSCCL